MTGPVLTGAETPRIRLDRWLFHARVFKTRSLAAGRIQAGGIRVNGQPCRKPARLVGPGDRVIISAGGRMLAFEVLAVGDRRGPASEARGLYRQLDSGQEDSDTRLGVE